MNTEFVVFISYLISNRLTSEVTIIFFIFMEIFCVHSWWFLLPEWPAGRIQRGLPFVDFIVVNLHILLPYIQTDFQK